MYNVLAVSKVNQQRESLNIKPGSKVSGIRMEESRWMPDQEFGHVGEERRRSQL